MPVSEAEKWALAETLAGGLWASRCRKRRKDARVLLLGVPLPVAETLADLHLLGLSPRRRENFWELSLDATQGI